MAKNTLRASIERTAEVSQLCYQTRDYKLVGNSDDRRLAPEDLRAKLNRALPFAPSAQSPSEEHEGRRETPGINGSRLTEDDFEDDYGRDL